MHIFEPRSVEWRTHLEQAISSLRECPGIAARIRNRRPSTDHHEGSAADMLVDVTRWIADDYAEHLIENPPYRFQIGIEVENAPFGNDTVIVCVVVLSSLHDVSSGRILYGVTLTRESENQYWMYESAGVWAD